MAMQAMANAATTECFMLATSGLTRQVAGPVAKRLLVNARPRLFTEAWGATPRRACGSCIQRAA